jgi:hypothetical protein
MKKDKQKELKTRPKIRGPLSSSKLRPCSGSKFNNLELKLREKYLKSMEIAQIGTLSRIPSGFRLPNRNEKEAKGGFQGRGAKGVYLSGRRQARAGAHDQGNTSGCGRGEWSKAQRLASQQSR